VGKGQRSTVRGAFVVAVGWVKGWIIIIDPDLQFHCLRFLLGVVVQ
jgi:hypothetical protein